MSNLSDKELDRLSREAADLYEPDVSSLSWSSLEQKLAQQMPERPPDGFRFGRINPYFWGPAVVMLAGVSFFLIKNNFYSKNYTPTNTPVSQSATIADSIRAGANTVYTDSNSSDVTRALSANNQAITTEHPQAVHRDEYVNRNTTAGYQRDKATIAKTNSDAGIREKVNISGEANPAPSDLLAAGSLTGAEKKAAAGKKHDKNSDALLVAGTLATAGYTASTYGSTPAGVKNGEADVNNISKNEAGVSVARASNTTASARPEETAGKRTQSVLPAIVYTGTGPGKVQGNDSLLHQLAKSESPVPNKSVHINRSLNVGLAFGPDYTDAGGITNDQLSNNIGITIGYYLTNKISVNTGIFYSNKFYWSPGKGPGNRPAYSSGGSNGSFAYAPDIEYVNGSCNMYEVPLTLRYDFAQSGDKTRFFVNAGLSSYFMLKQTYIYFFHNRGRALAWKTSDENQSNYWFGVGDLSFGLETDMGKGFSFQAEPFLRIPLQQMGVENLKLNSYGILLSFRYAPVLSRSKR